MQKRRYDNRQREEKATETRTAILNALARQLVDNNSPDFSVADAARAAGVSTRTVFRHFPTREHMLEGISEWVRELTGQVPIPKAADDLPATVVTSYRFFDQHAALMRALLLSDLGRGIRSRLSPSRRKGISQAIDPVVAGLTAAQAAPVKALIGHLITAETWWQMRDGFGIKGDAAAEVAAWAIRLMVEALERGDHPFRTRDAPARKRTQGG
ncbi:MAG: TetR/AcrR family transcriptional regulator [Chromatiales bacterium]|jgi:AcrR family transcriptional regulator|nr:TetR/AcrR family transcriptional regulator [Chromatiales bacterium]MDX9768569.1 TetR/AcrR family transcriptional regulator [Ectothiorhodospiraceae bacterium]